jgi:hypothetical protein
LEEVRAMGRGVGAIFILFSFYFPPHLLKKKKPQVQEVRAIWGAASARR